MKYDYSIILSDAEDSLATECDVFTGSVEANTTRQAVRKVLNERTAWLEYEFNDLSPTIEISRNSELGVFEVNVDSHGLGVAGIVLEQVS